MDFSLEVRDLNKSKTTVSIMMDKGWIARVSGRKPYKALPNKFRLAMERVGDYVRAEMVPEVFEREGPGWRRLARRTIVERLKEGYPPGPILQRTRDLFQELTDKSHPKHVEVVKVGKEARIEIGGSSVKFLENQQGVAVNNLPARPMIPGTGTAPIDRRHIKAIEDIFRSTIAEELNA